MWRDPGLPELHRAGTVRHCAERDCRRCAARTPSGEAARVLHGIHGATPHISHQPGSERQRCSAQDLNVEPGSIESQVVSTACGCGVAAYSTSQHACQRLLAKSGEFRMQACGRRWRLARWDDLQLVTLESPPPDGAVVLAWRVASPQPPGLRRGLAEFVSYGRFKKTNAPRSCHEDLHHRVDLSQLICTTGLF